MIAIGRPDSHLRAKTALVDEKLRQRIELSRVVLIVAIVLHHIRMPAELSLFTWDNLGYVRGYVQIGLLKTATSTLTIISGFLLFSSRFEHDPAGFIAKKFRTLFVPLLLWNLPIALLIFAFQRKGQYLMKYDNLSSGDLHNWANALLGLTTQPANGPLHFLRNLIGCNIIALAIAGLFRRYVFLVFAVIVVAGLLDLEWPLLTRNDMLIGFFLGGLVSVAAVDVGLIDGLMPVSVPCFLVSGFFMFRYQVDYDSLWWLPHRLLGFLAVWPLIGHLSRHQLGRELAKYSKYTFVLFLSHYYAILLSFALFSLFFTLQHFYIYAILAGPVAVAMSIAGQRVAARFFPRLLSLATGGRVGETRQRR